MLKIPPIAWLCIFLTIAFTVIGQLLVKKGMLQVGASPGHFGLLPRFLWRAFTNTYVIIGLICAFLAALAWTVAISRAALSVAYPFISLGLVLVLAMSGVVFGEKVPINRWVGVIIVCIGIAVAARN